MKTFAFPIRWQCILILPLIVAVDRSAAPLSPEQGLRTLVTELSNPRRNWLDPAALDATARFIRMRFEEMGMACQDQEFEVDERTYRNVECILAGRSSDLVVIGAHYDVAGSHPGADDNASGVAGLIELARRFHADTSKPRSTIRFVAYTLEEPPFYGSENMGSHVHAKKLHDSGLVVNQMISLEMIGYAWDTATQDVPPNLDSRKFPRRGDFYAAVSNLASADLTLRFKAVADRTKTTKVVAFSAPDGVGWSDHMNYWKFGYPAFMITDTAFLRNRNYHRATDTPGTLNYKAMEDLLDVVHKYLKQA